MATKKNFTKADGAVDKFFVPQQSGEAAQDANTTKDTQTTNNTHNTKDTYNTQNVQCSDITNAFKDTNKSKHYNERGKRTERFGLLLDEQLKGDLRHLSMATGNKSINDFIVTILLEYVEREENQTKLSQYRKLLQG